MIELTEVVSALAVAASYCDAIELTEQRVRLRLGQRPLSDAVRVEWTVQLDQRWPDGGMVVVPWDRAAPIPDGAVTLICRGQLR